MYSNESVQKLTDSLTRRADRASEVVEELDRLDSPSLPAAEAKSREAQDALAVVQAWAAREKQPDPAKQPNPTPAPTEIAVLRNDVEELREKLHIARGTAEIAHMSADAAQRTADSAIVRLEKLEPITTDQLKAGVGSLIDSRIVAAQVLKHHDVTPPNPNLATADTISPCREGEQVLSRSEVEELRVENARLRELLGVVDGHAGEIVSALAGEVSE